MKIRIILTIYFSIFILGCATPVPKTKPITFGIFDTPPAQSNITWVESGKAKTAAVILSENTKVNVEYLKERKSDRESEIKLIPTTVQSHIEILDPNYSLSWIAKKLKNTFGSVKVISSKEDLNSRSYDYLILVDAVYYTTDWGVDDATASFTTQFYDGKGLHILDVKSYRKVRVRGGVGQHGVELFKANHAVRVAALEEWERSFDQLIRAPSNGFKKDTDKCVRSALSVQDPDLRHQAISACSP